jgi:hypothetical protein
MDGGSGYTLTVSVVDHGASGTKGDTISITIRKGATKTLNMGDVALKVGNVAVAGDQCRR